MTKGYCDGWDIPGHIYLEQIEVVSDGFQSDLNLCPRCYAEYANDRAKTVGGASHAVSPDVKRPDWDDEKIAQAPPEDMIQMRDEYEAYIEQQNTLIKSFVSTIENMTEVIDTLFKAGWKQ